MRTQTPFHSEKGEKMIDHWNKRDITGQRFGRLVAVRTAGKAKDGSYNWLCRCDCKNTCVMNGCQLRLNITKSCGCLQKYPEGEAAFNLLYSIYKENCAGKRKLEWSLTKEQFRKLTKGDCDYCGIEPRQIMLRSGMNGSYVYNGVDRKDNLKGYTFSNCVSCCKQCNLAKSNHSIEGFFVWIE